MCDRNCLQSDCVKSMLGISDDIRVATSSQEVERIAEPTLVILDTGIAIEETDINLQRLRLLFRAVIDKQVITTCNPVNFHQFQGFCH